MAGRGGRGGRGRGGRSSVTQELIRDNMEDLGIEAKDLATTQVMDDRIPPELYPVLISLPCPVFPSDQIMPTIHRKRRIGQE